MKLSKLLVAALPLLAGSLLAAGDWSLGKEAPHTILYQGKPLIETRSYTIHGAEQFTAPEVKSEAVTTPDGKWQVFNRWRDNFDGAFREELAIDKEGKTVEVGFQTFFDSYSPAVMKNPIIAYTFYLPFEAVKGMHYKALTGRVSSTKVVEGDFPDDVKDSFTAVVPRYFALEGKDGRKFVFDFNLSGVGDYHSDYGMNCLKGQWVVIKDGDKVRFFIDTDPDLWGGPFTGRVRMYSGTFEDYDKQHAMRSFNWGYAFPANVHYSFGATKAGKDFTAIDTKKFDGKAGWVEGKNLKTVNDFPQGVRFSAVTGKNGKFKVTGLRHAVYWVTLGCGNFKGSPVQFTAKLNGIPFKSAISVPHGKFTTAAMPLWIDEKGELEVELDGNFRISTLGIQCVLGAGEDMNFNREMWLTKGFEPGVLYQKGQYEKKPVFAQRIESFTLCEPGKECNAKLKTPPQVSNALNSQTQPAADWRYNSVIQTFGPNNAGTLHDYAAPGTLERRIKELKERNVDVIITNGMLSRHTYFAHIPRIKEEMKRYVTAAHKAGMHLMDHQDVTLLWNVDAGFRAACERFDELQVQLDSQLPSPYFCFHNPTFRKHYFEYIKDYVKATGVDAIMFDEVMLMEGCCTCAYCREKFHEDTGWYFPADETNLKKNGDNHYYFSGPEGEYLTKVWNSWRMIECGNFFVDLRKAIDEVKPEMSIVSYVTHYCLTSHYSSIGYGNDLVQMSRGTDFPGTEITTRNVLRGARYVASLRRAKNMLHIAYDTPMWGLISSGDQSYPVVYFGWALNNMNGQSTWINDNSKRPDNYPNFLDFRNRNMDHRKAKSVAKVALLFSTASRDFGGGIGYSSELLGLAQTLGSMHIPYDIIGEMSLDAKSLAQYDVLYLGSSSAISDAEGKVIKEFAKRGGTVYLTTTAGWEDQFGKRREEWLFKDVFGFNINYDFSRPKTITDPESGEEVKLNFEPYYCHPDYRAEGKGQRPSQALLWARNAAQQRYPLMVKQAYGKGTFYYQPITLALHLCAPEGYVGRKFDFRIDPWLDKTYRKVAGEIIGDACYWKVDAPDLVLTTVYKQDKTLLCHFLNATIGAPAFNEEVKFGVPEPAFPPLDKDITFTLKHARPSRVVATSPDYPDDKELKYTVDEAKGELTVTLPKELMKVYTMVRIEE